MYNKCIDFVSVLYYVEEIILTAFIGRYCFKQKLKEFSLLSLDNIPVTELLIPWLTCKINLIFKNLIRKKVQNSLPSVKNLLNNDKDPSRLVHIKVDSLVKILVHRVDRYL